MRTVGLKIPVFLIAFLSLQLDKLREEWEAAKCLGETRSEAKPETIVQAELLLQKAIKLNQEIENDLMREGNMGELKMASGPEPHLTIDRTKEDQMNHLRRKETQYFLVPISQDEYDLLLIRRRRTDPNSDSGEEMSDIPPSDEELGGMDVA